MPTAGAATARPGIAAGPGTVAAEFPNATVGWYSAVSRYAVVYPCGAEVAGTPDPAPGMAA
jgi:hypothetical protein